MDYLDSVGISVNKEEFIEFCMIIRPLKTILLNLFYTLGGIYMIYCWYHDRVEHVVRLAVYYRPKNEMAIYC